MVPLLTHVSAQVRGAPSAHFAGISPPHHPLSIAMPGILRAVAEEFPRWKFCLSSEASASGCSCVAPEQHFFSLYRELGGEGTVVWAGHLQRQLGRGWQRLQPPVLRLVLLSSPRRHPLRHELIR